MARGGKRIGAGRKPMTAAQKVAAAAERKRARASKVVPHPSSAGLPNRSVVEPPTTNEPSPVEEFDAPNDLGQDERAVWLKQAPHAFRARTLTRASALAFERYCKVAVLERNEAKSSGVSGPNHRGLLKLVRDYEMQFMLIPAGKPMVEAVAEPVPTVDENDAFFGDGRG